jgi:hypothetical protein
LKFSGTKDARGVGGLATCAEASAPGDAGAVAAFADALAGQPAMISIVSNRPVPAMFKRAMSVPCVQGSISVRRLSQE